MRASLLPAIALLATGLTTGLASGPAMAQTRGYAGTVGSSWVQISLDMPSCLRVASQALSQAGYIVDEIGPNEQTVFAGQGGDAIIVRCITNHQVAVIATHSPAGHNMMEFARSVGTALRGDAAAPPARPPVAPPSPDGGSGGAKQ